MPANDVISSALQDAGLVETDEMGELVGVGGEEPEAEPASADAGDGDVLSATGEPVSTDGREKPVQAAPDEGDDLDKELAGLGVRGKSETGEETRIRYGRVKRMWGNYKEKFKTELEATHKRAIDELNAKIASNAQRLEIMANIDRMLSDPTGEGQRRYFNMLAMANPTIRQILSKAVIEAQGGNGNGKVEPAADNDPEPQPDYKFGDGSTGFTAEQHQKHTAWLRRQAVRDAEAALDRKYGVPIQQLTQRERQMQEQRVAQNRVEANFAEAKETYGQLFTDDIGALGAIKPDSKIVALLNERRAAGRPITFERACAIVLIPKMQANRDRMRSELQEELNKAPAAARSSAPAAAATSVEKAPEGTENIVYESMRKAGMLR